MGKSVMTNSTKIWTKRFDGIARNQWDEMRAWCRDHLWHGGHYEPRWGVEYPTFYFWDEKEYALFLLRWA
jgi:hypothetical protein